MTQREGSSYREAGHGVMAYIRKVDFESLTILLGERDMGCIAGCNYDSSIPNDFHKAEVHSYADTGRVEIGLAGPFAQALHVGGFTPGRGAAETYLRAMNACLNGSEDDAVQYALAREVGRERISVGQNLMDEVLSSPYARDILFDVADHWRLVEAVATALMERGSLSQAELHQIIQATER
jgi:hypothetical protein